MAVFMVIASQGTRGTTRPSPHSPGHTREAASPGTQIQHFTRSFLPKSTSQPCNSTFPSPNRIPCGQSETWLKGKSPLLGGAGHHPRCRSLTVGCANRSVFCTWLGRAKQASTREMLTPRKPWTQILLILGRGKMSGREETNLTKDQTKTT